MGERSSGGGTPPRGSRPGQPGRRSPAKPARRGSGAPAARGSGKPERRGPDTPERRGPARPPRDAGPEIPEDITGRELDRAARSELAGLPAGAAEEAARRLVAAGLLLEDDPELAYRHAVRVKALAARLAVAREALGLAAYATGRWAEARSELRAFQRMTGSAEHLAVLADCERGLGEPRKALELAGSPAADRLDPASRAELRIVAAGARADLGQAQAAVVTLRCPELESRAGEPWVARLRYAYADALLAVGEEDQAREWFARAAEADSEGSTDAVERLAELDGFVLSELDELDESEAD